MRSCSQRRSGSTKVGALTSTRQNMREEGQVSGLVVGRGRHVFMRHTSSKQRETCEDRYWVCSHFFLIKGMWVSMGGVHLSLGI